MRLAFELRIAQKCTPDLSDKTVLQNFQSTFYNPEPYFLKDSIDKHISISEVTEEVSIHKSIANRSHFREIKYSVVIVTDMKNELLQFFRRDGVLCELDWDLTAFARHFLGDWESVLIEGRDIAVEIVSISGSAVVS